MTKEIRPRVGARVEHASGALGTVLACSDSKRHGYVVAIEWEELDEDIASDAARLRSPSAERPEAFHVGLIKVIA